MIMYCTCGQALMVDQNGRIFSAAGQPVEACPKCKARLWDASNLEFIAPVDPSRPERGVEINNKPITDR